MRIAIAAAFLVVLTVLAAYAQEEMPFDQVVSLLTDHSMSAEEIRQGEAPQNVAIVTLGRFEGAQREQLQEVLEGAEDMAAEIRTAIAANEGFEKALTSRGVKPYTVIAVTRDETGTVFYVDRTPYL